MKKESVIFMVGQPAIPGDVPTVLLGLTEDAWNHCKNGDSHTFDLTKAGVPVRIVLFGAKDQAHAFEMIQAGAKMGGIELIDERKKDFSIQPPKAN